jgi:hypothetical protein
MLYSVMKNLLLILAALLLFAAPASADLGASSLTKVTPAGPLGADSYVELRLRIDNASPDFNWIAEIDLRFPPCCTVVAMSYDDDESTGNWVFDLLGVPGSDVSFVDGAGNEWGEIPAGDHGFLDFTVHVGADCAERATDEIRYDLYGDGFGAAPHELLDLSLPLSFEFLPASESSVSTVKTLY